MSKRNLFASIALLGGALAVAPALATVTPVLTTDSSVTAPAGTTALTFDTADATAEAQALGYTLVTGGITGQFPAGGTVSRSGYDFATPLNDTTGFFGIGGNSFASFTGATPLSSISFYAGSIDTYNRVGLLDQSGNVIASYTGDDLYGGVTPFPGNATADDNKRVTIANLAGIGVYGVKLSNAGAAGSFEFDNLAFSGAVPEAATWAMMVIGFGAMGATLRKRRQTRAFDAFA